MANHEALKKIAENFYQNIHALRIFNEQIGSIAEQHDKTTLREFISGFSQVVGLSEDELDPEKGGKLVNIRIRIPKIEDLENLEPDTQGEKDENQPLDDTMGIDDKKEVIIDDPEKAVEFIRFMEQSKKKMPYQTRLLRQGALINLVIFYETLVGKLLQYFYLQNPLHYHRMVVFFRLQICEKLALLKTLKSF